MTYIFVVFPNFMISKYGLISKGTRIMVELQFYSVRLLLIVLSLDYFTQSSQVCNTSRPMVSAYVRRLATFYQRRLDLCLEIMSIWLWLLIAKHVLSRRTQRMIQINTQWYGISRRFRS